MKGKRGGRNENTLKRWREGSGGGAVAGFPLGYSAISEPKFLKMEDRGMCMCVFTATTAVGILFYDYTENVR